MQSLVGGRFAIERAAGTGGMARVYRALDVTTNEPVAVKLLHTLEPADLRRFDREIAALRGLSHPNIVRYVAHGSEATSGEPYLAIEWLEGKDLASRLEAGPLSIADAIALGRAVAGGLAIAHARGIVHRDIKPGNLFLVGGEPARTKVLDFGLARDAMATAALTRTGDILGTPLYMAPEQARGETDLDPRVDLHALGAVLFACLTGRPPFSATNLVGLLAKVAVDIAPRARELRPDIPEALDALIASLLGKRRDERPASAVIVHDALAAIESGVTPNSAQPSSISVREQRVVCILLAIAPASAWAALDVTHDSRGSSSLRLADGTTLVTFTGPESPADLATRAVRGALQYRATDAALSLATGRAVLGAGAPVGEAIDRASRELANARGLLRIDATTAGLVEGRFEMSTDEAGAIVHAERGAFDTQHTLLGKPTRCVGRDRELAAIEGFFAECEQDRVARVVIVTADAGVGKSRLAREVVQRLSQRIDDERSQPQIVVARAESTHEGVPFALLADAIQRAAGFAREDDLVARRDKLVRLLGPNGAEIVGEITGVPASAPSEILLAARENPSVFFEQLRRAVEAWLVQLVERGAVALVLEDVHWADASSLTLLDVVLRGLVGAPLLVLALARPTLRAELWSAHRPHVLRLDPLSSRASERLVRQALGEVADDVVRSIVERAGGNALFLEELVRAARADVHGVPLGIVATLQLRFDTLSARARLALRAASVFGEHFDADAVAAVVPGAPIGSALDELIAAELVHRSSEAFAFRHALVRDAAYTLLADEDRAIAHALAARHLETTAASAAVIAGHYEHGRDIARATEWHERAAAHALALNDFAGARFHATRATELAGEPSGAVSLVIAEFELYQSRLPAARAAALRAIELLPSASHGWFEAAGYAITSSGQLGDNPHVVELMARVAACEPPPGAVSSFVQALARGCTQLLWTANHEAARDALARIDEVVEREPPSVAASARLDHARSYVMYSEGRIDRTIALLADAGARYRRFGAVRDALQMELLASMFRGFGGLTARAESELRAIVDEATAINAPFLADWARTEVGMIACFSGRRSEGVAIMESVSPEMVSTPLFRVGRGGVEGWTAYVEGDREALRVVVERLNAFGEHAPHLEPIVDGLRGALAFLQGDPDRATVHARNAASLFRPGDFRADVRAATISLAGELLAVCTGDRSLLERVCDWIEEIERRIADPEMRYAHRHVVLWNRRALELAGRL